ncbi:MAG: diaminopimelate epimerase [Chlamydiota bacterium]
MGEEWIGAELVKRLCHRHTGIGADGLIAIGKSDRADCRMRIFNADGSEPAMCGNGIRCAVHFLGIEGDVSIETLAGVRHCRKQGDQIAVRMGIPQVLHFPIECLDYAVFVVDTGVPHAVLFVEELEKTDVAGLGRQIRFHPHFAPHGVNVNFARLLADGLEVRTYERGVEAETKSCGTGAAAVSFVAKELHALSSPVAVGELEFHFLPEIEMVGTATPVFKGTFSLH